MPCLSELSRQIFLNLGEPTDISIPAISFWLTSNIGRLNALLDGCFEIVDNDISPELNSQEASIYSLIYSIDYAGRQARLYSGAGAYTSSEVIEFKEGNRSTKLNAKTNNAKLFLEYQKDLRKELDQLIMSYKMNLADPRQSIVVLSDGYYESSLSWDNWRNRYFE